MVQRHILCVLCLQPPAYPMTISIPFGLLKQQMDPYCSRIVYFMGIGIGHDNAPDLRYTKDIMQRLTTSHEQRNSDRISGCLDLKSTVII